MSSPPETLDGATVLFVTIAQDDQNFGTVLDLPEDEVKPIAALAICRYSDAPESTYVFACSAEWEVIGDLCFSSTEEARQGAEDYYQTGPTRWISVKEQ
jgi:hypothetical protein